MPKGSKKPYNRGEKKVVEGMKMLRKSGAGKRQYEFPGAEGTPEGAGTYDVFETDRQQKRERRMMGGGKVKGYKGGGCVMPGRGGSFKGMS